MADPEVLRDEARRLRQAARAMRERGGDLDDHVRDVQTNYPLPSETLWQGPYATTYDDTLQRVRSDLTQVGRDVERYADDCDDKAASKDLEADALEAAAAAAAADPPQ